MCDRPLDILRRSSHGLKRSRDAAEAPAVVSESHSEPAGLDSLKSRSFPPYGKSLLPKSDRQACEDHFVATTITQQACDPIAHVFAVYDGHGGSDAASRFAASRLHELLQAQLSCSSSVGQADTAAVAGGGIDSCIKDALRQAFQQTDAELGATLAAQPLRQSFPGTTATVAVVTSSHIHLAWAGDSRAVVLGGGKVLLHTEEHRTDREDEQERLTAAGCRMFSRHGPPRVMGVLATTRAIGDHDLRPYGVVPTPEVVSLRRDPQQEFLVVATDGLWDYITNEEAYSCASETLRRVHEKHAAGAGHKSICCACHAAGVAAKALLQRARARHSPDDITVIVVNLKTPCSCARPLGAHYTHNSSLLSKKLPERLARTGGLCGSCSADQLSEPPVSPAAARQHKGAKLQNAGSLHGAGHSASNCGVQSDMLQLQQPLPRRPPVPQQQQQPLQPQQRSPFGGLCSPFSAVLATQPSVCPGAAGLCSAPSGCVPAACPGAAAHSSEHGRLRDSDLVMASPFAGVVAAAAPEQQQAEQVLQRCRVASITEDDMLQCICGTGRLAAPSGSAPSSFAPQVDAEFSVGGASSGSGGSCEVARTVGSAPADMADVLSRVCHNGDQLDAADVQLSLSLALAGRGCGLLGSVSLSALGSNELPLAVTT